MKSKKSKQANLEITRLVRQQMGLLLALGFVFIAFEYSNASIADVDYSNINETYVEVEYVPITRPQKALPPPPPPVSFLLPEIVDDNIDIPDEIELVSLEPEDYDNLIITTFIEDEMDPDEIFTNPEEFPEFPGGYTALMTYLSKNIDYPNIAEINGISGKVFVEFVVNKDGTIVDVKILKGVHQSLDEEAMRVIKNMPAWSPGKQSGKAVRVSYRIPIKFALR